MSNTDVVPHTYDPAKLPAFCFGVAVIFVLHQMQLNAHDTERKTFGSLDVTEKDLGITKEQFIEFEEHMSSILRAKKYQKTHSAGEIYQPEYASKDVPGGHLYI